MGKTRFEKSLEQLSNNERTDILDNIRNLFLNDMKTDEEIGKILNVSKTAIKNVRFKYGIVKSYNDISNDNAKRNAKKYMNNDLKCKLTELIFKELPYNYKQIVIKNIQSKINENKYSQNELGDQLHIAKSLLKYLKENSLITYANDYNKLVQKYKQNNKSSEELLKEKLNRSMAQKNRSPEEKQKSKEKRQETCLERFGVKSNLQTKEVKEIVKNNSLKKYGVENPIHSYKSKQTKLERYGDENYNNREKYKETYNNFSNEKKLEIRNKTEQTCIDKYGVKHHMLNQKVKDDLQNIFLEKYNVTCPFLINPNRNIISKNNLAFEEELYNKFKLKFNMEININNKSFDFGYNKLLIELNPTITHNSNISFAHLTGICNVVNCTKHKPLSKDYHYNKWKLAKDNGYELISIFDWYDVNKVLSLIKSKLGMNDYKIGARQTTIKIINKQESKKFLNNNHILGYDKSSDIIYGLYYKDLLVSVMSFGKPRYAKDYEWELLRFANLSNYTIYGSASRLWNQFLKDYNPKSVITYTNNDFGNGNIYVKLGFKFQKVIKSSPVWNIPYKNIFIKHSSLIRQGADRLLKNKINNYFPVGLNYDDFIKRGGKEEYCKEYSILPNDTTWWPGNIDIMRHYGFVEVYSTGTSVYIYEK